MFTSNGVPHKVWEDPQSPGDGRNQDALLAFKKIMIVSTYTVSYAEDAHRKFSEQVITRMKDPPFFCTSACQGPSNMTASLYADQLHDAFYAYAKALNITLSNHATAASNGSAVLKNIEMTFQGELDERHTTGRQLTCNDSPNVANVENFHKFYTDEKKIWSTRGGVRPTAVPKCGFEGNKVLMTVANDRMLWTVQPSTYVHLYCYRPYMIHPYDNDARYSNQ
ncbi:Nitrogen permease regulator 2 [Parelaphostrongylus tenuis]|uniref:Nitrogen permease regulator 2 n=1 Tax=Parelaphostrongylus tenuis TaxID=148309 RepID=A0AAD5MTX2_PARTN|nr:Nitrogen permease regulator 2 [Parelaphostrongylus tenuis]